MKKFFEPVIIRRMEHIQDAEKKKYYMSLVESNQRGNFGGEVWWQNSRLVHSVLLSSYAISTLLSYKLSYIFSIIDVSWAIFVGVIHYSKLCPALICNIQVNA